MSAPRVRPDGDRVAASQAGPAPGPRGLLGEIVATGAAELRAIRADRGAMAVLVVATLLYALVYPVPYRRQLAREIPIVVVDQDATATSRQLARMVDAAEQVAVVGTVRDLPAAEAMVRRGRVRGVVLIPPALEQRVQRGERAVVGVLGDASSFMLYSQIATGVSGAVGTLSAGVELRRLQATGIGAAAARRARDPLPVAVRSLYNPSGGYGNAVVPAVLILILQQTLLIGIGMLAGTRRERGATAGAGGLPAVDEPHVVARVLGRTGAYVALYLVHAGVFFVVVYRVYDLPRQGSLVRAVVFLLPFLLAVALLGLAISRLFRERESALQALLVTSLPAIFISGFSFPAEAMPGWVRALAWLLPSTHGIAGAVRVVQMNATLAEVRGSWLALWTLAGAYFGLACVALRLTRDVPDRVRRRGAGRGPGS